ncbi:mannose-1-phosphate guanylyltransferase/mannose-6-phosphate isomerase [Undibacterium sp. GrIS 1.8]|uniref:mannose-1-phosphate guanylyltransferase/mannose-6-phosphate isomerase n=1 Tax=Undibacterium sp. GrIS 1.8 TaxID=3143934 RepID=UPI003399600B
MIYPVILSGGSGTRLWPLSRAALPKQFLKLASENTLFQESLLRLSDFPGISAPLVVCNNAHRFLVAEQLLEINKPPLMEILEPVGRNTAPAVAIAAFAAQEQDTDAVLLVLPADHLIANVAAFHKAIHAALALANQDQLVTFGIEPDSPSTGFGYIERGAALNIDHPAYNVARFVEKPNQEIAKSFLASGDFFWNSGMFVFKASVYLRELQAFRPDIYKAAREAWEHSVRDLDFCRLDEAVFATCPSESIDYAVMEHTKSAAMVTVNIGWSDIGSWSALADATSTDAQGNSLRGDVYADQSSNSYIRAESRMVAAIGVKDLVIVETADAVLVMHKDLAQDVKQTVEYLKKAERSEHLVHQRMYRPWGYYEGIDIGDRFQVKRIMVKPGAKLSLQMHYHRAEHWIVVSGTAKVVCGNEVKLLHENESTYIPIGQTHRLENVGRLPLFLIEVQSGSYLGEDDIVRFEDDYKRV